MRKRRRTKTKYLKRPKHSSVALFFTSFLLTLTLLGALAAISVADSNSTGLGWNRAGEVFACTQSAQSYDFSVMGGNISLDRSAVDGAGSTVSCIWGTYCKIMRQFDEGPSFLVEAAAQKMAPGFKKLIYICGLYL